MKLLVTTLLVSFLLISLEAHAQPKVVQIATETIRLQLNPIVSSTLETSSDTWNTFVFEAQDAYQRGIEKVNASAISIKSNLNWVVTVRAEEGYFRETNKGGEIPVSILSVRANDGEYVRLGPDPIIISQSSDLSVEDRIKKIALSYKAHPDKLVHTGSYSVNLIFTVTSK